VIEGVAAPESANNAAAQSSFIPLLSLGIPPNVVMAVLFGGLLIHGIQPGPLLIRNHPDIFWGVVMSMYIGNVMLLALNLPLIGMWVKNLESALHHPLPFNPAVLSHRGYSVNNSVLDIYLMILFGVIGYFMRKFDFEPAPLALAYVLSPMLETSLRQVSQYIRGSFFIFFSRPISLVCMVFVIGLLVFQIYAYVKKKKPIIPVD